MSQELYSETQDAVRWIVLHRPSSKNGLTPELCQQLAKEFDAANEDPEVRTVVLFGNGGAFCSGLDLKSLGGGLQVPRTGLAMFQSAARALHAVGKPTLAAIDGAAAGFGADLALGCDLRLVSERGALGERFTGIGLVPDGGGTYYLPKLVGRAKAMELIYEGRMVKPTEGIALGLFNKLVATDDFRAGVQTYAAKLAKGPPLAYAAVKHIMQADAPDLNTTLALEGEAQLKLVVSEDFMEGIGAFLEKREPNFKGA